MIEELMCSFRIDRAHILARFAQSGAQIDALLAQTHQAFATVTSLTDQGLNVLPNAKALTRLIARALDAYDGGKAQHSSAI
jgi:oxygen-independent coproporphyrinogen-3 oxidase